MRTLRWVGGLLFLLTLVAVLTAPVAAAARPAPKTFVAVMTAANEVPHCAEATNASRGVAIFRVVNQATGTVSYRIVANNLPGTITAAHIHVAPPGSPGPIVQPLALNTGKEHGVIGAGTFTNPALLAAMQANPGAYYVNVHSSVCPSGVIRGQLGKHGPKGAS